MTFKRRRRRRADLPDGSQRSDELAKHLAPRVKLMQRLARLWLPTYGSAEPLAFRTLDEAGMLLGALDDVSMELVGVTAGARELLVMWRKELRDDVGLGSVQYTLWLLEQEGFPLTVQRLTLAEFRKLTDARKMQTTVIREGGS